jgi:hypothetical protein
MSSIHAVYKVYIMSPPHLLERDGLLDDQRGGVAAQQEHHQGQVYWNLKS